MCVVSAELTGVDLTELLSANENLIRQTLGEPISLALNFSKEGAKVQTDKVQLEAALLNLASNARDAMPEGGQLMITVRRAGQKNRIELSVSDTGHGMPQEVIDRALDPFFTTKASGKGTGLGLAQVQRLMLQSGGRVELSSTPGAGATVTLVFLSC